MSVFRTRAKGTAQVLGFTALVRSCCRLTWVPVLVCLSDPVLAKDPGDSDDASRPTSWPNIYLDLRTNYATVPANTLSIGFSSPSLSTAIAALRTLSDLSSSPRLSSFPARSSPSSQSIALDVPLTVDVTDAVSLYGGVTASASQSGTSDWSSLAISSWNVGFQADLYQQNGGSIPTITLQTTITRSVPDSALATTSFNNIVEFDYALNEDETNGLLAGAQYTRINVDSPLATINPNTIGYLGGYYQWPNNWKLTGRAGVQSFGGAQLLNLATMPSFTQPIVRLDLDRMDDNDNRLFGVTAQIAWTPKPAYQLTIRTPLYFVRN
ncbi:hypothetical protein [Bradyrhizobium cosmicum]|uniref:hypothetical protein n=1 Tax=Bradyrhizobium cosmicum TaxID=1404864 RepID=UPI0028EE1FCD|nr:hypothetical protein [Bradyrhizobium cosmicum]